MKRFSGFFKILALTLLALPQGLSAFGGTVPAGLPNNFGIGADDKFDDFAPFGPHKWKDGQGSTCWDYSYVYMVPGWRGWVSPDGEWAKREFQAWESRGQIQVFTFYYSYGATSYFQSAANMATYWGDLAKAFQLAAQYTTRRVIFHFEPDGIGFWRLTGSATYDDNGVVIVGGATSPTGGAVNGLAWNTTNFPNTLQGWNKAIWHLRLHYEALYGGTRKILLAHHYTHWATNADIFVNPTDATFVTNHVNDMSDYILNIENGLNFDLFFADPADRDADFWQVHGCSSPGSRWANASYNYTWGTRSWGTEAYAVNAVSNRLARRGFMWQVPVGNTYMRTVNNSNGHYRDNRVQAFLPSAAYDGASGTPGDAYSNSSTTSGPGFWAQHGLIGVLFGSGGYENTPAPCDGGGDLLTHQRDRRGDSTVPGADANAGRTGAGYSVWGQHAPTNAADDDGGYLRSATARYCTTGKYPLGPVPTPTRTPTACACSPTFTPTPTQAPADCPLVLNSGQTLAENGTWSGTNATRTSATFTGSTGNALRVAITTGAAYNNQMANLSTFAPAVLGGYNRMSMKVYVDPANLPWSGLSTYHQFRVRATSSVAAKYEVTMGSADVALVAGLNNVSFDLTFPGGPTAIAPTDAVSTLHFIMNMDGQQAGVLYIDEITLHTGTACPPTPTATRTSFGSPTFTPTATRTPADCPTSLNSGDTLTVNGAWTGINATRSAAAFPGSTGNALRVDVSTPAPYANRIANLDSHTPQQWASFTRMTLKVYVDPTTPPWDGTNTYAQFRLRGTSTVAGKYEASFGAPDVNLVPGLQTVEFPFTWPGGASGLLAANTIDQVFFILNIDGESTGTIYLDEITLHTDAVCPPPTATSTITRTATRTASPSPTASATRTRTPTGTASRTPTGTPSATTLADTPTSSATRTASPTPTGTRTATGSQTPTATRTASRSATSSVTPTVTRTASPTLSITPTFTDVPVGSTATSTFTFSPTATRSGTPSATPTATSSRTASPVATATSTFTAAPTGTFTRTSSPSATATSTPSRTATSTSTATPSPTLSVTPTFTDVPVGSTATNTPTQSPVQSATFTPVDTATFTPMNTATFTPMNTATFTPVNTATFTSVPPPATATSTHSPVNTPANTSTRTATATATLTRTNSPSPAGTLTRTPTATPTATPVLDSFDPADNVPGGATVLVFSTSTQTHGSHTLSAADSADWFRFDVLAGERYQLGETGTAGNARIDVYSDAGATLIAGDDNSGGGTRFAIDLLASANGTWYARVSDVGGGAGWSGSLTYVKVPAATATATPVVSNTPAASVPGPLEFEAHRAWPNPAMGAQLGNARVAVKLKGDADGLTLKLYTRAMTCVGTLQVGSTPAGWRHLPLPAEFTQNAGNGTYFYVVSGTRGGAKTVQDAVGRLTVLR